MAKVQDGTSQGSNAVLLMCLTATLTSIIAPPVIAANDPQYRDQPAWIKMAAEANANKAENVAMVCVAKFFFTYKSTATPSQAAIAAELASRLAVLNVDVDKENVEFATTNGRLEGRYTCKLES